MAKSGWGTELVRKGAGMGNKQEQAAGTLFKGLKEVKKMMKPTSKAKKNPLGSTWGTDVFGG